jgi:hypothetical protein
MRQQVFSFYTTISIMMIINTKAKKNERFIDLASLLGDKSHITYICKDCNTGLILDAEYQIKNPFSRGRGYICGSCQKTYDDSIVRLPKKPRPLTSTIGDSSRNGNQPFFAPIPENKDGTDMIEDEYSKYDPEPNADQQLINSGATIIRSEITLTDSEGRNRTLVRIITRQE